MADISKDQLVTSESGSQTEITPSSSQPDLLTSEQSRPSGVERQVSETTEMRLEQLEVIQEEEEEEEEEEDDSVFWDDEENMRFIFNTSTVAQLNEKNKSGLSSASIFIRPIDEIRITGTNKNSEVIEEASRSDTVQKKKQELQKNQVASTVKAEVIGGTKKKVLQNSKNKKKNFNHQAPSEISGNACDINRRHSRQVDDQNAPHSERGYLCQPENQNLCQPSESKNKNRDPSEKRLRSQQIDNNAFVPFQDKTQNFTDQPQKSCLNCWEWGHYDYECPKLIKDIHCTNCGSTDRVISVCDGCKKELLASKNNSAEETQQVQRSNNENWNLAYRTPLPTSQPTTPQPSAFISDIQSRLGNQSSQIKGVNPKDEIQPTGGEDFAVNDKESWATEMLHKLQIVNRKTRKKILNHMYMNRMNPKSGQKSLNPSR